MKVYSKTIKSQLDVLAANAGSLPDIDQLAVMKARLEQFQTIEIKLKKLNAALMGLALAERPLALKRLQQAQVYVESLKPIAPQGVSPLLKVIANELVSLREGLFTGNAKAKDLVLVSGVETLSAIKYSKNKLIARITASEGQSSIDPAEQILLKNKQVEEKIPSTEGKEFVMARVPVSFGLQTKNYTSVGYIPTDTLDKLGFKAQTLDGYVVMHNQLVIGVTRKALENEPKVKESTTKFSDGRPTRIIKRRPATTLDVARNLMEQLRGQTKTKYILISDTPSAYRGASWYWIMTQADATRFARIFPGGHLKLPRWGFAFSTPKVEKKENQ